MPIVTAADNLTIQYDAARWYLYNGRGESEMPAASAAPGGMAYTPAFAFSRRLPEAGFLPVDHVMLVALGYAAEDSAWHLGVMLTPEAAATRGSRWCGLARWQADDAVAAEPTARALANLWEKPFKLIPPSTVDVPPPTAAPEDNGLTDLPLMPLPILADDWQFNQTDTTYQLSRSPDWRRGLLLRAIFFSILAPLFALLSLGALATPFARVSPEWLPFVGLAIAFLMLGLAVWQFRTIQRESVVVLDRRGQLVRLTTRNGRRVRLQFPYESADYVLISHVVSRRKPNETDMDTYKLWAEVWIHIYTVRRGFIELAHIHEVEGRALNAISFAEKRRLHFGELDSPAHHIGGWLAHELDVPAYVEER